MENLRQSQANLKILWVHFIYFRTSLGTEFICSLKKFPCNIIQLLKYFKLQLHSLVLWFIYKQEHKDFDIPLDNILLNNCLEFEG